MPSALQENAMQTTWIVAADEHRVRIFEVEGKQSNFREYEDFINPEARMKGRDFNTDAAGRYFGKGQGAGDTSDPRVTATQHTTDLFAKSIGEYLNKARLEQRYDKLRVIAFPKFLGALRKHLSKATQETVEDEISKDISQFAPQQIEEYIKTRLQNVAFHS
jgi:protein required for attachment to host cells